MSGIECLSYPSCYCPNCFLIVFLNSVLFSTCLNHILYDNVRVMREFNFTLARSRPLYSCDLESRNDLNPYNMRDLQGLI